MKRPNRFGFVNYGGPKKEKAMDRHLINAAAERLQGQVNARAKHDARDLGVGSIAERSVYEKTAQDLLGDDWEWTSMEGIGVSPQIVILRYRGLVE